MITIAPYWKSVIAAGGHLITAVTAITTLLTLVPTDYAPIAQCVSVLIGIVSVATPIEVYLKRNEPLAEAIDGAIAEAGPVVDAAHDAAVRLEHWPAADEKRPSPPPVP